VSRWFPERLRVALSPDRAALARVRRLPRLRVTGKEVAECAASGAAEPWGPPLEALSALLSGPGLDGGSAAVVLSNRFVRYALVPWRDAVTQRKERIRLARHCFRNIYGDAADGWEIRLSDGGFGRNAIASAVDRDLIAGLREAFAARRIRIASVEPCFMSVCNRFRNELPPRGRSGLAVLERGRVTLGVFEADGWQVLAARRVPEDGSAALAALFAQEMQSAGMDGMPEQVHVFAADAPPVDAALPGGALRVLSLKAVPGFSPLEDARLAMALCGAA
jgi:hypothetical protein